MLKNLVKNLSLSSLIILSAFNFCFADIYGSSSRLQDLTDDVNIVSPADLNLLQYDSASSMWVNRTLDAVTLDTNVDTLLSLSTQALGLDTQAANTVFAGRATVGAAQVPTFRALVALDIPDISATYLPLHGKADTAGVADSATGNAGTATALATARAINGVDFNGSAAITVPVNNANDVATNATMYPLWTATQGGNYAAKTSLGLTYNPSTGIFTAAGFSGPLTGNVTGNASGSSGSCTGNAGTVTNGVYTTGAGTVFLAPAGSAAALTSFPTLNQNTSGTAANVSGTPVLPNGTTATTQAAADNSTKLATTAYANALVADAINDATTGIAPSQNAVFDALALKSTIASPTFTTQITTPVVYGSSADNGDITIEGTSSATKTTSYVILQPTSGNVGIGTTSPGSKLQLYGGDLTINSASNVVRYIGFQEAGTNKAWIQYLGSTSGYTGREGDLEIYNTGDITFSSGNVGIGITAPTAVLHLKAGTATASTAPLKFTSGVSLTTAVAGNVEFTTDDLFFTITTGAARKAFILDDGTRLTSGKVPVASTNGRLIDSSGVSGTFTTVDLKTVTVTNGLITSIQTN